MISYRQDERDGCCGQNGKEELVPKHGGYRRLKSFQIAQLVYDVTVRFCDRYIDRWSRTRDQMVQAARSGVQNIAEGSQASGTSKKTELKLTNVARASLEELRLDYEDFLRHRGLPLWEQNDRRRTSLIARRPGNVEEVIEWVREIHEKCGRNGLCGQNGRNGQDGRDGRNGRDGQSTPSIPSTSSISSILSIPSTSSTKSSYPEIATNAALTLIAVASSLLDRQLAAQAKGFEKEGGFTERIYRIRQQARKYQKKEDNYENL